MIFSFVYKDLFDYKLQHNCKSIYVTILYIYSIYSCKSYYFVEMNRWPEKKGTTDLKGSSWAGY